MVGTIIDPVDYKLIELFNLIIRLNNNVDRGMVTYAQIYFIY